MGSASEKLEGESVEESGEAGAGGGERERKRRRESEERKRDEQATSKQPTRKESFHQLHFVMFCTVNAVPFPIWAGEEGAPLSSGAFQKQQHPVSFSQTQPSSKLWSVPEAVSKASKLLLTHSHRFSHILTGSDCIAL